MFWRITHLSFAFFYQNKTRTVKHNIDINWSPSKGDLIYVKLFLRARHRWTSKNYLQSSSIRTRAKNYQKQPSKGIPKKRCSENMQQIYRRTPMPKYDLNKVALQLYWNRTSALVFSCKFVAYFQNTFS